MKRVFIDCGYHLGEGMYEFTDILQLNDTWEVHTFEANPACEIATKVEQHPFPIHAHTTAVWIANTQLRFNQEHQVTTNSPTNRSTNPLDGWGSFVSMLATTHDYATQVEVPAIDFAEFLSQFTDAEIYCKMDIEGSEFPVLRHLLATNTLKRITRLWVEWHPGIMPTESDAMFHALQQQVQEHTELVNWK